MKLKIRNKLTRKRVGTLIALICLEQFVTPISVLLNQGVWPTPIQVSAYATTAVLQAITLAIGVLESA